MVLPHRKQAGAMQRSASVTEMRLCFLSITPLAQHHQHLGGEMRRGKWGNMKVRAGTRGAAVTH